MTSGNGKSPREITVEFQQGANRELARGNGHEAPRRTNCELQRGTTEEFPQGTDRQLSRGVARHSAPRINGSRRSARVIPFSFVLLLAMLLTACGDRPDGDAMQVDTTALPVDTMGSAMDDQGAVGSDTVAVSLVDFEIGMPTTLPAGPTVFDVTNDGTSEHNFEIEGQGMEQAFPEDLLAGESMTMEVDLQPGTYTIYCPVADHRTRGMELELSAEPAQGGVLGN